MPINLDLPLDLRTLNADETALLLDLQGNILKGHGREYTANIFLTFDPVQAAAAKTWIKKLKVTSAQAQLEATAKRKAAGKKNPKAKLPLSPPAIFFFLSAAGYAALGVAPARRPAGTEFSAGMKASQTKLKDPAPGVWDKHFRGDIHAMLLIGGQDPAQLKTTRLAILASLPAGAKVLGEETGRAWKNQHGDGIEHFGYVDGRSQPLLIKEDIEREQHTMDGTSRWNAGFPIKQVLVPDPAGKDGRSFGSFFVFRKLEQNVKGFKARSEKLADALGLKGAGRDRAGAQMVGRFKDGTPLVLQEAPGMHSPVPNNFDFRDDAGATKCPFHSHIRKTNPRGESPGFLKPLGITISEDEERTHIMARRGITYGTRAVKKVGEGVEFTDNPSGGAGLLFMAYQSDFGNQFEFTQATWANNQNFVKAGTGIDPVIGQGASGGQSCPLKWGGDPATSKFTKFDFRDFVTMKGGEYFFAPSLSTLKSL